MSKVRLALIQLAASANKPDNISRAISFIQDAARNSSDIVVLPECFNSPYGIQFFKTFAEKIPGPSTEALAKAAAANKLYVVGGSIPEEEEGKFYNTCTVFGPDGELIAKHRKVHLFDIDIPGKITFKESEVLSPGRKLTTFTTGKCKVGIGICYDMRFAEMAQIYANKGCSLLIYPGAFNMTTGPAHWEKLQLARALDNQLYTATVSPARDTSASYVAWGHSTVVSPWGEIVVKADEKEGIIYADIDLSYVEQVRRQIPLRTQKRHDVYSDPTELDE